MVPTVSITFFSFRPIYPTPPLRGTAQRTGKPIPPRRRGRIRRTWRYKSWIGSYPAGKWTSPSPRRFPPWRPCTYGPSVRACCVACWSRDSKNRGKKNPIEHMPIKGRRRKRERERNHYTFHYIINITVLLFH